MARSGVRGFFTGSLKPATGHGELWEDEDSPAKFSQYGWRCTTNENQYSLKTLMGNWNEERFDIQSIARPRPLPSQYAHCFETTYAANYAKEKRQRARRFEPEPHWFPGHQPELDPPLFKCTAQSCYSTDYRPPPGSIPCAHGQHSEKEREGCRKSNGGGENLQAVPAPGQQAVC